MGERVGGFAEVVLVEVVVADEFVDEIAADLVGAGPGQHRGGGPAQHRDGESGAGEVEEDTGPVVSEYTGLLEQPQRRRLRGYHLHVVELVPGRRRTTPACW